MPKPVISITTGEPAGIGPEISIRGAYCCRDTVFPVLIGDYAWLKQLARKIDTDITLHKLDLSDLKKGIPASLMVLFCTGPVTTASNCPFIAPVMATSMKDSTGRPFRGSRWPAMTGACN